MEVYYAITFFLFGTILGSFYNVVGYRLPRKESLITPSSHCPNCNHRLTPLELIPIFSFLLQGRKCKNCKQPISWFYTIFELLTGILFAISYLIFGFSIDLVIAIIFSSVLVIVMVSDYNYMIICDEVLIVGIILISICLFIKSGLTVNSFSPVYSFSFITAIKGLGISYANAILAFVIMYIIKLFGDFVFGRESMGGGDIKLLFFFGLVIGLFSSIVTIFLGSIIGFPIALLSLKFGNYNHEIPFGPYLSIAALILFFLQFDFNTFIKLLTIS